MKNKIIKMLGGTALFLSVLILVGYPSEASGEHATAGASFQNGGIAVENNIAYTHQISDSRISMLTTEITGWQQSGEDWYYYDEDGTPVKGWKKINGVMYYFDLQTGKMYSNGSYKIKVSTDISKAYVFQASGALVTTEGWYQDPNTKNWYYVYDTTGELLTGWNRADGIWYYFSSFGVWNSDNSYEEDSIKGIDVSKYQGIVDWEAVKKDGYEFAFLRVGYGSHEETGYTHFKDTTFDENMQGATAAGIPVGTYLYCYALTEEEAVADADFMIEQMTGYKISYPVVIDLEDVKLQALGKEKVSAIAKAFCDRIVSAGYTPMVYTGENFYKNYIDGNEIPNVDLWVARYNYLYDKTVSRTIWQCGSTGKVAGINGYVDIDFSFVDYTELITPRTAPIEGYKDPARGQWIKDSAGWWYRYNDSTYPVSSWKVIDGSWYYFNAKGYMVTGWQAIGGKWYYFSGSGAMQTGWQAIGGKWYYFSGSGAMVTGWQAIGGKWYYFSGSGAMQTGWQAIGGKWYYFSGSGAMQTGWQKIGSKWYYFSGSGAMQTGWQKIGEKWYYFNSSGEMATNQWVDNYYVGSSGAMSV